MNTLLFFSLKFKIVPFMVEKNVLAQVFKSMSRDAKKSGSNSIGLPFEGFKEALFRIVVKSKQLLNDIVQKKKNKEQQASQFLSKQSSGGGNHFDVGD